MKRKNTIKLFLDFSLLIGFIYLMSFENRSGINALRWHEWIGFAGMIAMCYHLWLNRNWIAALPKMLKEAPRKQRTNILMAGILALNSVLIGVTGILISTTLNSVSLLGLSNDAVGSFTMLHTLSAKLFIPIIAIHLGLHWRWLVNTMQILLVVPKTGELLTIPVTNHDASKRINQ